MAKKIITQIILMSFILLFVFNNLYSEYRFIKEFSNNNNLIEWYEKEYEVWNRYDFINGPSHFSIIMGTSKKFSNEKWVVNFCVKRSPNNDKYTLTAMDTIFIPEYGLFAFETNYELEKIVIKHWTGIKLWEKYFYELNLTVGNGWCYHPRVHEKTIENSNLLIINKTCGFGLIRERLSFYVAEPIIEKRWKHFITFSDAFDSTYLDFDYEKREIIYKFINMEHTPELIRLPFDTILKSINGGQ